jgi:RHS repeat-associated protein
MSELYHANGSGDGYDSLNQLTAFSRGVLSDSNSDGVPDTIADPTNSQDWSLDAMGNWSSVTTDAVTQNRTTNAQNEITGVDSATLAYDANGNMTTDETGRHLIYDAWNRLVEVKDASNTTIAINSYDGLGRRISETHGSDVSALYYSDKWQVLEERNSSGTAQLQYVWSPVHVDAMVLRDRDTDANGSLEERFYVQQDANWNVTAILSTSGSVMTRFAYDPYGAPIYLTPNWAGPASTYGWHYLHQGGRLDDATGLFSFRNRDLSPTLGRWIQNDPSGFSAGDTNLYCFVNNNPVGYSDPSGQIPVSLMLNVGLTAWDTYQYFSGGISGQEYAKRMAFNAVALAIDAVTLGYGGALIRGGQFAMRFAIVAKVVQFASRPGVRMFARAVGQLLAGAAVVDGVHNINEGLKPNPCTGNRDWDRVIRGAFQVAQGLLGLRARRQIPQVQANKQAGDAVTRSGAGRSSARSTRSRRSLGSHSKPTPPMKRNCAAWFLAPTSPALP